MGLRAQLLRERSQRPPSCWPEDWWQRDYELLAEELAPGPIPYCGRQLEIPPPPGTT